MTQRPIILFDVMETLVTEPFFTAMPEFFGMTLEQLLRDKHPTSWIEFEKGQLTEAEYLACFFRDRRPVDGDSLRECLRQSYRWLEGMEALVNELHQGGWQMHALSNYSRWYEIIDESLQLSRYLRWSFVSCRTGVRKPDPAAYVGAAQSLGVSPPDCLFIDDREENVAASVATGMDAVRRIDSAQLRQELATRGLVTSHDQSVD